VFTARARDAEAFGRTVRRWPCSVVAHTHWKQDFAAAAAAIGRSDLTMEVAVADLNSWVAAIEAAR
jgi:hypothetical protein